jgi:hypothetical protein
VLLEFLLAEHAREETAVVRVPLDVEDERPPQPGLGEDHLQLPSGSGGLRLPGKILMPAPSEFAENLLPAGVLPNPPLILKFETVIKRFPAVRRRRRRQGRKSLALQEIG